MIDMMILDKILLMLGVFACGQVYYEQQNSYFEIIHVTSQEWIGGARGGGRGTNYKLSIAIKTDKSIAFDSIWVAGKRLYIKLEQVGQQGKVRFDKNDTVTLLASDYIADPGMIGRNEEEKVVRTPEDSVKAPVDYKGAALLKYQVEGIIKYFEIPNIKVLPTIRGQ